MGIRLQFMNIYVSIAVKQNPNRPKFLGLGTLHFFISWEEKGIYDC